MKLNISFSSFKKKHKLKKDQLIYRVKHCKDYKEVENIFNFLLVKKNSFIFESVEKGSIRGRYTIIGLNPDKVWDINKNIITEKFNNKKKILKKKPLNFLNNLIDEFSSKVPRGIPKMAAMLVGYFSYDTIRYIENIPDKCADDLKIPDVRMIRPNNLVIYDNLKKKIYFIEHVYAETKIKNYFEKYQVIKRNLETYEDYSNIKLPIKFTYKKNNNPIKSNISKNQFKNYVKKAIQYSNQGDIIQVV
jgi:anthranilate synthase component 1